MFINTDRLSVTAVCMLQGKHKLWALTQPRPQPNPDPDPDPDREETVMSQHESECEVSPRLCFI